MCFLYVINDKLRSSIAFLIEGYVSSIIVRDTTYRSNAETVIVNGFLCRRLVTGLVEVITTVLLFACRLFIILSHRIVLTVFTQASVRHVIANWCSYVLSYYAGRIGTDSLDPLLAHEL